MYVVPNNGGTGIITYAFIIFGKKKQAIVFGLLVYNFHSALYWWSQIVHKRSRLPTPLLHLTKTAQNMY